MKKELTKKEPQGGKLSLEAEKQFRYLNILQKEASSFSKHSLFHKPSLKERVEFLKILSEAETIAWRLANKEFPFIEGYYQIVECSTFLKYIKI